MRSNLLYRRNPLAYPSGTAPGFDPTHPASNGISGGEGISIVATNGNFVDLATGRKASPLGTTATAIYSMIGPGVPIGTNEGYDFSGYSTSTPTAITLAAIVQFDTFVADYQSVLQYDTAAAHGLLATKDSGVLIVYMDGDIFSPFTLVANTPYFLVCSVGSVDAGVSGVYNFLTRDLRTGVIQTSVVSGLGKPAPGSTNGTYRIGNNIGTTQNTRGPIAAAMYAPTYLTVPQLVQWAADPWAFWYPRPTEMLVAAAAAASATYAAFSIPQLDGRTYTQMIGY